MAKAKILIVDDERDFVRLLAERFETRGFDIIKAFNGAEALEKAHLENPDIIVLDLMMPVMNGYDACRKLKIDDNLKNIPVVMLTGKFEPSDIEFGKEVGADAYLTKPVEMEMLQHKVDALLRMRRIKNGRK
ncbi:MAG: response regulator [Candidatus Omnitrophota bacterium]